MMETDIGVKKEMIMNIMYQNKITVDLHPLEWELIKAIRERCPWGELMIECREGLPQRIGRTTVFEKLSPS